MSSTVDWSDAIQSTEFQTETYSSEEMTASVEQNPVTRNDMTPYKTAFIVFGVTGTLSNGLVLLGFWLSGRSRMSSSSLHVTNHTTLEHSPFSDLSIFLTSTVRGLLFLVLTRPVFP